MSPPENHATTTLNAQQLFDILAAVAYLRSIGATAATPNFVRGLISSGQIPRLKIGKKFYLSKTSLDDFLARRDRRSR